MAQAVSAAEVLIATHQLRWAGHIRGMDEDRFPKVVPYSELMSGKRSQGGQKLQLKDTMKRNMKKVGVPHDKWEETKAERDKRRGMLGRAMLAL